MAILINKNTRVITQGISGKAGRFHTEQCHRLRDQICRRSHSGKRRTRNSRPSRLRYRREAKKATICDATMIFVPAPFAADAILEAEDAGIPLIICITEGIPIRDMVEVSRSHARQSKRSRLIGPNCPGIITPGECKIGIMPGYIHQHRQQSASSPAQERSPMKPSGRPPCWALDNRPASGSAAILLNGTNFIDVLKAL